MKVLATVVEGNDNQQKLFYVMPYFTQIRKFVLMFLDPNQMLSLDK